MAASRKTREEPLTCNPRPSRTRRIPGHLEDYVLSYNPRNDYETAEFRESENTQWQYMQERWKDLRLQMEELQDMMDSAAISSARTLSPKRQSINQQAGTFPPMKCPQPQSRIQRSSSMPLLEPRSPHIQLATPHHESAEELSQCFSNMQTPRKQVSTSGHHQTLWEPFLHQPKFESYCIPPSAPRQWQQLQQPVYSIPHLEQSYVPLSSTQYPQQVSEPQQGQGQGQVKAFNQPVLDPNLQSLMQMAIVSSFGIPKPNLPTFSSGKETDFILLKKGLDSLLGPHPHLTEDYKYQVLLDHLKFPSALQVAKRYLHDPKPYTSAMNALQQRYGQPRQLIQAELGAILNAPAVRSGDAKGIEDFALSVSTLVGFLSSLGGAANIELQCGSHVDRLLTKLPPNYRDAFAEHCVTRGIIQSGSSQTYTLIDFADWLERKAQVLQVARRATDLYQASSQGAERRETRPAKTPPVKVSTIYLSSEQNTPEIQQEPDSIPPKPIKRERFKPFCPYCNNQEHYLNACSEFTKLDTVHRMEWIKDKERCWKCGRGHKPDKCTLKKPCSTCGEQHLQILHDVVQVSNQSILTISASSSMLYIDQSHRSSKIMLKVVQVILSNGKKTLNTYAVLDDGSERTIILPAAVRQLGLDGRKELLELRTIRQDVVQLKGATVEFAISAASNPRKQYSINSAFTADQLNLAEQSCPLESLQRKYKHLRGIPLKSYTKIQPMVLIGSDHPHLIIPIKSVRQGPPGGPVAVCTQLGWTLQGPAEFLQQPYGEVSCLHSSIQQPIHDLHHPVERLWQLDTLPFRQEKDVTRSKQDKEAMEILETKTTRVKVSGVQRYATPLLWRKTIPFLHASPSAVMSLLRSTERRLTTVPERASEYNNEVNKLLDAGYVVKITSTEASESTNSWYIPHHLVHHNNKARLVFNCSFVYQNKSLNNSLLPGPSLSPSLLGVLLRFREYPVAVSGDIRAMFHQIRLLPEDQPVLRFLWRDLDVSRSPDTYEWRVLPFGTTCSPCCAIFALQKHVREHAKGNEAVVDSVHKAFYVDNCLQSFQSTLQAKQFIEQCRVLLAEGGFDIRQWASNIPDVITHLPRDARSESCELWLTFNNIYPEESTLGLRWDCSSDILGYKFKSIPYDQPTMRNIYRVLASQYDPIGYLIPFITRAKILVQALWKGERDWDEPIVNDLLQAWNEWENELLNIPKIVLQRCYTSGVNLAKAVVDLHVFCDASQQAYGCVSYLLVEDARGNVQVSFLMARSRVAPKKQLSVPRLELCAALTGAQLVKLLQTELSVPIRNTFLWTDSTTVLNWINSESCHYKVFVGTRIAEIQELTSSAEWRYVESAENPADDITRGKTLLSLTQMSRWNQGPSFLLLSSDNWPEIPKPIDAESEEMKKSLFCGLTSVADTTLLDLSLFTKWEDLIQATHLAVNGAAAVSLSASERIKVEVAVLQRAQRDSFPEEVKLLSEGDTLQKTSRLYNLSPQYDKTLNLIRVGGRLRKAASELGEDEIHPIVLSPDHTITKILIRDYDERLLHPGPERVFAEIRRTYWILRGRQAIRSHQRQCVECRRWRGQPVIPKMADLPNARLRIQKPPFWSAGVDCFGPFTIKIGRRLEKRWGIIFKCLTTRCVHLDLIPSMDTDSFLLALRRFIARRGKPYEIVADRGTNFRGGDRELKEAFATMETALQEQLARQSIDFHFNPPHAPHFGGAWEREIRSVKNSLHIVLKDHTVSEDVLHTVLVEVEGILNAKPLGYVSSDIADPDPVTPNLLLMGRRDASLPQAVYGASDLLGRRRWKHSQVLADHFWSNFTRRYLPDLQQRHKWKNSSSSLNVGQIVLIIDPQLPRAYWPVGKVTKVIPSDDGKVRVAEVKVKDHIYTRPVSKLIELPEIPDE